ncbi:chymotrypsinogen B [Danaus plexippus]|uniref:chymotrypsinogen B n=1 Tax=Danaus plexippus TaxID=13037 RepID=UPI002AB14A82|nr:chymotrypsinogen B [Danaus plexippus]
MTVMVYFKVILYFLLWAFVCELCEAYSQRECGVPLRRHTRQPRERSASQLRIIKGRESKRGAWPWQVSLQLLHPNYGLIGHWCGGVLVHPQWLLTTAHCVHNELFNLPLPALWTAVLGEWDRNEQRGSFLPIERIILHHRFHNYQHDIALMKMTKSADVSTRSRIRAICLPPYEPVDDNVERSTSYSSTQEVRRKTRPPRPKPDTANKYLEKINNLTKTVHSAKDKKKNTRYNVRVSNDDGLRDRKIEDREAVYDGASLDSVVNLIRKGKDVSRSDKMIASYHEIDPFIDNSIDAKEECYATGWGRQQTNGSLTDVLLEAEVPILPLKTCRERYSLSLPLNDGHLCAGSTDGSSGACVGDSGGPLQCVVGGRWVLRGLTSFGSGCALTGVPDVYTNVRHYVAWIYAHVYAG